MLFGPALVLLLLASPPPAPAAPPLQAPHLMTFEDQIRELPAQLRQFGLSDVGIRIFVDGMRSARADIEAATDRMSEARHAADLAAETPVFDPRQFEAAFQRSKDAEADVPRIATEHELAIFRALSPEDQKIAARLLAGTGNARLGMPIHALPRAGH
jgi:uncharacterized membrane protein